MNTTRIERVCREMHHQGIRQLIVSAPMSVFYLTGVRVEPGERMFALLIHDDGQATLFANRLFALSASFDGRLTEYDDTEDCISILSGGLTSGIIGIDKTWPSQFTIRLLEKRPDLRAVIGSACVDLVRMVKDETELDLMRESSRLNDAVIETLIPQLHPGMTEMEAANIYQKEASARGAGGMSFSPLVCFGPNCAEPHHASDMTQANLGDAAILDVGLTWQNYCSDMTRTVCIGKASDELKRVYDLVCAANAAGRAAARPGIPMHAIDRAARKVIEDAGYGPYFIHRTGHCIGLECHEWPDVSSVSEVISRPGMVHSVEPGIYLPGKFGVRIEDLVIITPDGSETINHTSRELIELPV